MALHVETPLLASPSLSAAAGRTVWLKLESLQPSGSFKLRGIGVACETYMRQGKLLFSRHRAAMRESPWLTPEAACRSR